MFSPTRILHVMLIAVLDLPVFEWLIATLVHVSGSHHEVVPFC